MHIHTVKRGETIFHIARAYGTSPVKIIEHNGLARPETLMAGEELLICTPSRSYTVRGMETLGEIAERFSVKKSDLLRYNPALGGMDAVRPSMTLSIKYAPPEFGMATNLGYVRKNTPTEKIRQALPYLSYFVFDIAIADGEDIYMHPMDKEKLDEVKRERKLALLRIETGEMKESFSQSQRTRELFIERMIFTAKSYGYSGLVLSHDIFALPTRRERDSFLLELRKLMLGSDLILFCECIGTDEFGDFADANILLPSILQNTSEYSCEARIHHIASVYETQKTFLGLPSYARDGNTVISYERMHDIAYQTKNEFLHTEDEVYFDYTRYVGGRRESERVRALSLSGVVNILAFLSEYGFMGCALEIDYFRAPYQMMLTLLFSGVEYAFGFV